MTPPGRIVLHVLVAAVLVAAPVGTAQGLVTNLVPVADTTLYETHPDNNLGATPNFIAGTTADNYKNRAVMKFDLTALPAEATITSAALTLNVVAVGAGPGSDFALHRLLADWGEGEGTENQGTAAVDGEATWNNRFHPTDGWSTAGAGAGADYVSVAAATMFIDGFGSYTIGSTPGLVGDVQGWLNDPNSNFGWIWVCQNEETIRTARRFASREDTGNAPVLAVEYTLPAAPAAPVLSGLALDGDRIRFSFHAESNRTYAVEFSDSLTTNYWDTLTNIPAQPADATVHITNTVAPGEGYFRVKTP